MLDRGSGYVAVEWDGMAVVGVYVSPNSGLVAFEDFLDGIDECVRRCLPRQDLGDFNAHSSQRGNTRSDARGRSLSDWATGLGLLLVNRGSASTCVKWRGSSVIDVTWATTETYRRISNWRVAEGVETLSDHLYILMEVAHHETTSAAIQASSPRGANRLRPPPRWRLKERDREML